MMNEDTWKGRTKRLGSPVHATQTDVAKYPDEKTSPGASRTLSEECVIENGIATLYGRFEAVHGRLRRADAQILRAMGGTVGE